MNPMGFRLQIFLAAVAAVIALGTAGFMTVEKLSLADAFYFTIVTVATVGYGDIHPTTQAGKMLAVALIVMGVGTFLGVVANATELLLARREQKSRLKKLNMIVGVFFSEVGTRLLSFLSDCDPQVDDVRGDLIVRQNWSERDFTQVRKRLSRYNYTVDMEKMDLEELRSFLGAQANTLVRLLENPNLFEHETFADLLRAILHVKEELELREAFDRLPDTDRLHLAGDIKRAYGLLALRWLEYMKHLKDNYPYLFSLAMRTNPFDENASPIVK